MSMLRQIIRGGLQRLGYEVHRLQAPPSPIPPGQADRPVGQMTPLLEDLRARGLACQWILDVGANRGDWTRSARAIFPQARFALIEPQIEMKPELDALCNECPGCQWFNAAAGPQTGEIVLTVWEDRLGTSVLPGQSESLMKAGRQRRVPVVTIDSLIASAAIGRPQLVKMDIQGFELDALRGGSLLFESAEVFILETNLFPFTLATQPLLGDVVAFMGERGYVAYDLAGFLRRPRDGALGQVDVCFARKNGLLRRESSWS